jgi:hypothetical protein
VFDGADEERDCCDTIKRNFDSAASDGEDEERDGWKQGDDDESDDNGKDDWLNNGSFWREPGIALCRCMLTHVRTHARCCDS